MPGEGVPAPVALGLGVVGLAAACLSVPLLVTPPVSGQPLPRNLASRAPAKRPAPVPAVAATVVGNLRGQGATTVAPVPQPAPPRVEPPPRDCPPLFGAAFAFGSRTAVELPSEGAELVAWLIRHPETHLVIEGHADSVGTSAANLALSYARARWLQQALEASGLPHGRSTARALGSYRPVPGVPEDASDNRRISLVVVGADGCPGGIPPGWAP